MNSTEQDNINFLLNNYKDIVRNDDGTYRLTHRCIPDNKIYVRFVETGVHNHNELKHNCYRCKYCEPGYPFDYCILRTSLENLSIKIPTHYVANCDAYDPIECLNIIHDKNEMISFIEMVQKCFSCPEYCESYFGFKPKVDENTGEVLETIREYYKRGGEFINIPDKYPCVIYFPKVDSDVIEQESDMKWIYIGENR